MIAILKIEDEETQYVVNELEEHNNITNTVIIELLNVGDVDEFEDPTRKLQICNGVRQIRGLLEDHTITFSNK